ncbi:MAG: MFS transporter [Holophaga sp.]|nr:MFS transporter [Holophaga sp.]
MSDPRPAFRLPVLLTVGVFGFTSGVPLILTQSTLQAWMGDAGVDLKTVGLFALAGLPYTLKFLWSPLMDRYQLPFLGRRRGWMLVTFLMLMALLALLARSDPRAHLHVVALVALAVAFFSASADINVDAYRTELLPGKLLGPGTSLHITGYRLGMVFAGALALILADRMPWRTVYLIMALGLLPGAVTTFLAPEPEGLKAPRSLREAVVEPFVEFLRRKRSLEVLAFILLYKVGDNLCVSLNLPFFRSLDFSKTEIGLATKGVGMACLIGGGLLGGLLMSRWSLRRSLWVFGLLQMVSMSGHLALALTGRNHALLLLTIAVENSIFAMGTVAYLAMIQRCCELKSTATQFALLTSLSAIARVVFASPAGYLVKAAGWPVFFMVCMALAVPGLLLLHRFDRWELPEPR